jgi:hypothetical protein
MMDRSGSRTTATPTAPFLAEARALLDRLAMIADRRAMPPVITRASVVGAERSRSLFEAAYAEHARRIARAIIRDTDRGTGQLGQEVDPT